MSGTLGANDLDHVGYGVGVRHSVASAHFWIPTRVDSASSAAALASPMSGPILTRYSWASAVWRWPDSQVAIRSVRSPAGSWSAPDRATTSHRVAMSALYGSETGGAVPPASR